ncbi:TniQ family protein [Limimaricola sp. G21655-S1]|uniref:TniQ family protein n=1 Tax=Limimaricola sp. G21655-S1 TaxID=3014768 RepID=UPI0022AE7955|nr:TniQ family protein [Limimaricola sp. G21655-S1]MCZ4260071.1 TniQ family protein [Limimaricola sp. G21655-S1]
MLWPFMPLGVGETLLSYVARLGLFHAGTGPRRLLDDLGVSAERFAAGHADEVARLAEATGNDLGLLDRAAVRIAPRHVEFQGERLSKDFLVTRVARYCPNCLVTRDRADWEHRLLWGFRHVHRCPDHGVRLAATSNHLAVGLRQVVDANDVRPEEPVADEQPEYLDWLAERLQGGGSGDDWLGGQTIEQVLSASEMIGAVLQHGHKVSLKKLSGAERETGTDIGFTMHREGSEAVTEALTTIHDTSSASAPQAGPLAKYGNLYDWLDRRCNAIHPGPIRDLLREHIIEHDAVGAG